MQVKLSRRNLLSLLHKLEMPGSARTIIKQMQPSHIAVVAVTDEECYADRDPGEMHPETEVFVGQMERALAAMQSAPNGDPPAWAVEAAKRLDEARNGCAPDCIIRAAAQVIVSAFKIGTP